MGRSLRGATLVTALAFVTVVSFVVGGVSTVTVSHFGRADVEASYAVAIQLADAGINYQLNLISEDTTDPSKFGTPANPKTGSVSGVEGSFEVYVTRTDGSAWAPPADMLITSIGTVNGVRRKVQIRGTRKSIFDEYAIFSAYAGLSPNALVFNGTNSTINGSVGSNGWVHPPSAYQNVNGDIYLAGPNAGGTTGANVYKERDPVIWPTVDEIANQAFPAGGLTWLRQNNNNGNLRQFTATATGPDQWMSAGFPTSGPQRFNLTTNDFNKLNYGPTGWPFAGMRTMIFPPGDYYFENVQVTSGAVLIDNRDGRVRIWINTPPSGPSNDDTINANFYYLDPTPWKFRLYYNKCNTLTIGGNTTFYGGFYAWREGCPTNKLPALNFTGGSTIYGSVIGGTLAVAGGTIVNFPNDGGNSAPDDFSLWYGFQDAWIEVPHASGASTFAGGTSN